MTNRLTAILQRTSTAFLTGGAAIPGDACTLISFDRATGAAVTVATNEPCRVDAPRPSGETGNAEMNLIPQVYTLTVKYNRTLAIGMQVQHNGNTYEIKGLADDNSSSISNSALMVRITP